MDPRDKPEGGAGKTERELFNGRLRAYLIPVTTDAPQSGLAAIAAAQPKRGLPPVHLWHPENCGDIDIVIRRDGLWMHEGSPIGRKELVRLFSTVLRKDDDGYFLVTPVEKMRITVEDAPFHAVRVDERDGALIFTTDVGDETEASAENPLRVVTDPETGEPAPYVHVRRGLEARIDRPVFYELVAMAEERATEDGFQLGVTSNGVFFPLGPAGIHRA